MTHRLVPLCAALVATACFAHAAGAVTLYDPAGGAAPASPWMTSNGAATASVIAGTYRLDTTADVAISAGSARLGTAPLDTAGGVTLGFQLQVFSETHTSADRSGYSVIAIGSNAANAIEIAFWSDRIWAYGPGFTHGAEVLIDTGVARTYALTLQNQTFSLASGGVALLTSSLVDYRSQGAPYTIANTVFFGDDTSRGASSTALGLVTLSPVPEPTSLALMLLGGALLAWRRRGSHG